MGLNPLPVAQAPTPEFFVGYREYGDDCCDGDGDGGASEDCKDQNPLAQAPAPELVMLVMVLVNIVMVVMLMVMRLVVTMRIARIRVYKGIEPASSGSRAST